MLTHLSKFVMVDDDLEEKEFFAEALMAVNPNVDLVCYDSSQFMQALKETERDASFNIVFLDRNMPRFCGMDCLKAIRKNPYWRNARVIMYSTSMVTEEINN